MAEWLRPRGVSGPFTAEECQDVVRRFAAHWEAHGFGPWLAWEDEQCVAWSILKHSVVDGAGEVEIGWMLARAYWGRGVGTFLGRHALDAARQRGITDVVAFTRVDNLRSRRVMEKLGLVREREFEHAGLPHVLFRAVP